MSKLILDLSGVHWKMQRIRPGAGVEEDFHKLSAEFQGTSFNWIQAKVPGDGNSSERVARALSKARRSCPHRKD